MHVFIQESYFILYSIFLNFSDFFSLPFFIFLFFVFTDDKPAKRKKYLMYTKLKDLLHLPDFAVRKRMEKDGVSPQDVEDFFVNPPSSDSDSVDSDFILVNNTSVSPSVTDPFTPPCITPSSTPTTSIKHSEGVSESVSRYGKYDRMREIRTLEGAIRQKMMSDGISAVEIDRYFEGNIEQDQEQNNGRVALPSLQPSQQPEVVVPVRSKVPASVSDLSVNTPPPPPPPPPPEPTRMIMTDSMIPSTPPSITTAFSTPKKQEDKMQPPSPPRPQGGFLDSIRKGVALKSSIEVDVSGNRKMPTCSPTLPSPSSQLFASIRDGVKLNKTPPKSTIDKAQASFDPSSMHSMLSKALGTRRNSLGNDGNIDFQENTFSTASATNFDSDSDSD